MIEASPDLKQRFRTRDHIKTIQDLANHSDAADQDALTSIILSGTILFIALLDELHLLGRNPHTPKVLRQIRGGLEKTPEGLLIITTTQSDDIPAGAFKDELTERAPHPRRPFPRQGYPAAAAGAVRIPAGDRPASRAVGRSGELADGDAEPRALGAARQPGGGLADRADARTTRRSGSGPRSILNIEMGLGMQDRRLARRGVLAWRRRRDTDARHADLPQRGRCGRRRRRRAG